MYCWNCGKEMDDDLLFCPHCAMKQAGIPEPKPKKKIPVLPVVCVVVCLAALLGMILVMMAPQVSPPEEPVDPNSVALPDLAAFLKTQYTKDEVGVYTHHMTCSLNKKTGQEAMEKYLQLLQKNRYQLELDDSWSYSEDGVEFRDYIFRYTGTGDGIDWVYHKEGYKYHVKLSIYHKPEKKTMTVILYTAPGFEMVDPGVTEDTIS